jgi:rhodanese-related sulfurtransferase
MESISAQELNARMGNGAATPVLLDVRESWEFEICHIAGSRPVPMSDLPAVLDGMDRQAPVVVVCHHGIRSYQAALFLESAGFACVINLTGGIEAWADTVDPSMPRY